MNNTGPNPRSDLISFLLRNHFLVRGRGERPEELTHTLMDGHAGGRICLPDHAMDGFMNAYGSDLNQGKRLYVIERRTPVFKMHFDLDLKIIHTEADTTALLDVLHGAVASFLPRGAKENWCITCAVLNDERVIRKAAGLHIVFPWLFVDTEQALWLRASVVAQLQTKCTGMEKDWETAVDVAVLTTNGFRMVGSDKCKDCATCHNSRDARSFCSDCSRQGRVPQSKVYLPWKTLPEEATRKLRADIRANLAYAVRMCSTRIPVGRQQRTAAFRVPVGAPAPAGRRKALAPHGGPGAQLRADSVCVTPELRSALQETLATHHCAYAALEIVGFERLLGLSFGLKVRGFGCRFCQNKEAEHTQQTVYFVLSPKGIVQRCYSRKGLQRHHGLCESYASASSPLSRELDMLLFPEEKGKSGPVVLVNRCQDTGRSVRPRIQ